MNITTGGPLTITRNISAVNNIDIDVLDTSAATDDLTIAKANDPVILSSAGNLQFDVGDDFVLEGDGTNDAKLQAPDSSGTSTQTITINVDAFGTDPDAAGGTITIDGIIETTSPDGGTFLNGGDDDDTFSLSPQTTTEFTINGNAPVLPTQPGDTLNIDLSDTNILSRTLTLGGTGAGAAGGSGAARCRKSVRPRITTSVLQ